MSFVNPKNLINKSLSLDGTGTGTTSFVGDYLAGLIEAYIQPPTDEIYDLFTFGMDLTAATVMSGDSYGDGLPLVNGINFKIKDDSGTIHDFIPIDNIKSNADWMFRAG